MCIEVIKMAKKSWWQRFLDKLVAVNEKEYGNDVPDCCADGRKKNRVIKRKNIRGLNSPFNVYCTL